MITNHPTMTEFEVQRLKLTDILNNHTVEWLKTPAAWKQTSCLFTKRSQGVEFAATEDKSSQKLGGKVEPKATKLWVHSVRYVHSCVAPTHPTLSPFRGKNNLEIKKNKYKRSRNEIRNNFSSVENVYHFLLHCSVPLDLTICETAGQ